MTDSTTTATNTVTGMVSGPGAVRAQLDHAREHLAAADRVLTARVPDPVALHAAVDGAIRLANALAGLVTTVMRQAPAGLDHRAGHSASPDAAGTGAHTGSILDELLADLRAMHGCLTTGPLLLAPARDDLYRLITNQATHPVTTQEGGPAMRHHKPDHTADGALDDDVLDVVPADDVAEQQRPARPEPTADEHDHDEVLEQILNGVGDVLEADPADITDQRRDAPVLDDTEPWP